MSHIPLLTKQASLHLDRASVVLQAQRRLDADADVEQVMVFGRSLTAKKVRGSHRAVDTSGKVQRPGP